MPLRYKAFELMVISGRRTQQALSRTPQCLVEEFFRSFVTSRDVMDIMGLCHRNR